MKVFEYIFGILVLASLTLFLPACTDTPIFYTLEKAYSTSDDRGIDDNAVVEKIVYSTGAGDKYFVLAQSVYQRDPGPSSKWQKVASPAAGALCGGVEFYSVTGEIFAWFYDSGDKTPVGLYSRDPATDSPSDPWTGPITDGDWTTAAGEVFSIHFIKAVNGLLFVSTSIDSGAGTPTYSLYYSGTAASDSFTASNTDYGTALDNQILDVEHYGSSYWLITTPGPIGGNNNPTFLYEDTTDAAPDSFTDRSQDPGVPAFWDNGSDDPLGTLYMAHSLYYDSALGNLYLSGWHGRIFIYSGTQWSDWPAVADAPDRKTVEVGRDEYTVQFTAFADPGQNGRIFVGSDQYGYFYFSNALDGTASLSPSDLTAAYSDYEYFPSDLKNGAIRSFLSPVDAENPNTMFACTAGAGLWRGDWDSVDSLWIWKQE